MGYVRSFGWVLLPVCPSHNVLFQVLPLAKVKCLIESKVLAHICGKWMFYLGSFPLCVELQECFLGLDRMCLVLKVQNWAQLWSAYQLSCSELVFSSKCFAIFMWHHKGTWPVTSTGIKSNNTAVYTLFYKMWLL